MWDSIVAYAASLLLKDVIGRPLADDPGRNTGAHRRIRRGDARAHARDAVDLAGGGDKLGSRRSSRRRKPPWLAGRLPRRRGPGGT